MTRPSRQPFTLRQRQQVHRLAESLWEQHGHPGQPCEVGSRGIGSCAVVDEKERGERLRPTVCDHVGQVRPTCPDCGRPICAVCWRLHEGQCEDMPATVESGPEVTP